MVAFCFNKSKVKLAFSGNLDSRILRLVTGEVPLYLMLVKVYYLNLPGLKSIASFLGFCNEDLPAMIL